MKKRIFAICLALCTIFYNSITAFAAQSTVSTNDIANWPTGPELDCEAAILLEANSGVVLYAKNMDEHLYPASTTKMITALIAAENSDMNEMVSFSYDSVFSLEAGSSNMGIDPGQSLTMEECLYGLMVASANEVANAVGEHVAGDVDSFVKMMNDKVAELKLENTHFTNTNGLHDKDHYTSAYDLAIIANEFFNNEYLAKIGNTATYHFTPTATQPDDFYVRNKHQLINGDIAYPGIKGGKTGYTSQAGETLVTCSEQSGLKLICVVLNEVSPEQFYDTVKLFDYGFSNFQVANVAENESKYSIKSNNFFPTTIDILGSSKQILELDETCNIIMPKNIDFDDVETNLIYNTDSQDQIAKIEYSYHGAYLGYGLVKALETKPETSEFDVDGAVTEVIDNTPAPVKEEPIYINIVPIFLYMLIGAAVLILITYIISFFNNYSISGNGRRKRLSRPKRRKEKDVLKF